MQVDPAGLDAKALYRLMISTIVPRPIAWTSTISPEGVPNAAPFSYFQALTSKPPMVMISVGARRSGEAKDTRRNIEATREFVVNVVSEDEALRMVRTSVDHPPEVSEFREVGLTPAPSVRVKPPRIAESAVALECRLDRVLELGKSGILIGEVLLFHLRDDVVLPDGTVDPWKLRPLGRLGGSAYAPLREVVEITTDGAGRVAESELLDLWRELRRSTVALARRLDAEHIKLRAGDGPPVGALLLHVAHESARLAGARVEVERPWDLGWTPEKLVAELERTGRELEEAVRDFTPEGLQTLRIAIRHEAWHQGEIASALRPALPPGEVWTL